MRTRSISTATAFAVLVGSAALSVAVATPASAAGVSVAAPGGIVADGVRQRVFVGDSGLGRIVAATYSGSVTDSATGLGAVADLALSQDGSTLYAALPDSHEIVALDPATLDVKARYAVAVTAGPSHLAFAGGKVWFSYGDQWDGDIGSLDPAVDPAGGTDPVTLGQFPDKVWGQVLLDADPSAPGLLALGETGDSTGSVAVLDVSGGTAQPVAWHDGNYTLTNGVYDVDLVPGAPQLLVNGTDRLAHANGTFGRAGAYPAGSAADLSETGLVAQATGSNVAVYRPNATKPLRTYPGVGTWGAADLVWAPDSSRLFALVQTASGYTVKVLTDPAKSVPALTVNAPSTATRGKPLQVTGRISASVPLPAGVRLKVTRVDLDSPGGKVLPTVTVKADGTYSFSDTPPAGGTVTYKVAYAGDADHTAVTASDKVTVSRAATTLTLNNNGKLYAYDANVTFTAHLGKTYKNRTVEIWADPFGADKPRKLLKTATVNSLGNVSAVVDMKRDTTVSAVFKGDARYLPKTVKSTAYAKVRVSTAVSRHYRTGKIGSTTYYWFRKNTDPLLTTTMTYYPGRQQRFDLQVYFEGRWYSTGSEYFALAMNGKSAVSLGAPGEAGIRARMRSVYVNGSSGDSVNSTTYGSWKYLYFTN